MVAQARVLVIKVTLELSVTYSAILNVKFVTKLIQTNALNAMETRSETYVSFVKKTGTLLEIALWNVSKESM